MNLLKHDLFLFDFDGLLVDTEGLHFEAYRKTLQDHGCQLDWDISHYFEVAQVSSEHLQKTLLEMFPKLSAAGWDTLYAEKKGHYLELLKNNNTQFMPGALELLELLTISGKKCAVVTHSPLEQIDLIRSQRPELEKIQHWFTREDYTHAKPHPDSYLTAWQALGGTEPLGFEDSVRGLQSLLAAKIPAVLVRPATYPRYATGDATCLSSLQELLA